MGYLHPLRNQTAIIKQMKKIILIAAGLAFSVANFAQGTLKLGYINSQELLSIMPEVQQSNKDIEMFAKTYQDQLEGMEKEYEKKVKEYQASEKTMTEAVKEVKQKEIIDLQNRLQSTEQSAQEKITQKKQELFKPLLDKADKAIKDVAQEKGYDYIFDVGAGLLYAKPTDDILPLVKAKLGIK